MLSHMEDLRRKDMECVHIYYKCGMNEILQKKTLYEDMRYTKKMRSKTRKNYVLNIHIFEDNEDEREKRKDIYIKERHKNRG